MNTFWSCSKKKTFAYFFWTQCAFEVTTVWRYRNSIIIIIIIINVRHRREYSVFTTARGDNLLLLWRLTARNVRPGRLPRQVRRPRAATRQKCKLPIAFWPQLGHFPGAREPWRRWSLCSPNFWDNKIFFQTNQQTTVQVYNNYNNCTVVCWFVCKKISYCIAYVHVIAVVHFKNVRFKKFRPNCVLIQFAQLWSLHDHFGNQRWISEFGPENDIRTVVQQQHNTN